VHLRAGIQDCARRLAPLTPESTIVDLLEPIQALAESAELNSGSHGGLVIFRSPGVFETFCLTEPAPPSLSVAGCFAIRKVSHEFELPHVFYILALFKRGVSLFRCTGRHAERVNLPSGTPDTLDQAIALDIPDHDLENRSAAGSSKNSQRRVRFGTGSERETEQTHLRDYYKIVDRSLRHFLHEDDSPLVLAGVEEDLAVYRAVGTATATIAGSAHLPGQREELLTRAYGALRAKKSERQAQALMKDREQSPASRFCTDLESILSASFEGRIRQLYINEKADRVGVYERNGYQSFGAEDLFNLAVVQTIIHGGTACELPAEMMPDSEGAIGLLRY
jgi:release factor family 3